MKVYKRKDFDVKSTLDGERIMMGLDSKSVIHIMSILTDLYSDPIFAIIREYTTNAIDSHILAGQRKPIEVTLPNQFTPIFKVKDIGVGLSVKELHEVFPMYGASTKRETNDQIGMLGLGCKSALTYTSQFSVVAIKDGVSCSVSVSREEDGTGLLTVTDTQSTDEPDGVEIIVPVKQNDNRHFADKAAKLFSYWRHNEVLVNGKRPETLQPMLKVTNDIWVVDTPRGTKTKDTIVMGRIPYDVDLGIQLIDAKLVCFVNVGEVHFVPSREALHMDTKTKTTIESLKAEFQNRLAASLNKELQKAETAAEAFDKVHIWKRYGLCQNIDKFLYKDTEIPLEYTADDKALWVLPKWSSNLKHGAKKESVPSSIWNKALWIEGYDRDSFHAQTRKKIDHFFKGKGLVFDNIILCEKKAPREWLNSERIATWREIQKTVVPNPAVSVKDHYDCYQGETDHLRRVPVQLIIDQPVKKFFSEDQNEADSVRRALAKAHPNCIIIYVSQNRVNKLKRVVPGIRSIRGEIQELYKKWIETLPEKERTALALYDRGITRASYSTVGSLPIRLLKHMDADEINDPELKKFIDLLSVDIQPVLDERKNLGFYTIPTVEPVAVGTLHTYTTSMQGTYPLLTGQHLYGTGVVQTNVTQHAVQYINAVHEQKKGKKK